jgi:hypothetical protein
MILLHYCLEHDDRTLYSFQCIPMMGDVEEDDPVQDDRQYDL